MMSATTLRGVTRATRVLDLSASAELVCDNLMCAKVGELCLCKFSIALPKIAHVSELRLRGNGMDRWPELWRIPGLHILDVSENRLQSIPREIAQLSHLKELRISHNDLESLPEELAQLPSLRLVDARNNSRLRAVPQSLAAIVRTDEGDSARR
ncbi:hypothetical protein KFE25_009317 [Diacronema lutheri]|uniref:Leucine-rich repeat domain-containing protein n=1 Tax=Diacronema lutheri TaxID=2081491 RepID=A0A8J5XXL0_DIALT|nr:hypothetical protein KFE25_009317 [Diacronema lutheri]